MKNGFISLVLLLCPYFLLAQADTALWQKKLAQFKLKPSIGIQLWSTYTQDMEVYKAELQEYEKVDNRFNTSIRRMRLGLSGQPYQNLQFNITAALDFVGKDALSAIEGGNNNGASPQFRIWHTYLQWRLKNQSEAFNLVVGYFTPIIGREAISSALRSPSMEKAWSQNYLRRHLFGIGSGRAGGINIGGLLGEKAKFSTFQLGYDMGIFNPVFQSLDGNSTGAKWSPLFVGRVVAYFGDPELSKYGIGHRFNYFGKRKGLSLAFSGATQGATDLFLNNQAVGMDLLFNWGKLNLDGEWTYLSRSGQVTNEEFTVYANTGYLRIGYNILLKKGYLLEPLLMWVQFNGETGLAEQNQAALVQSLSGKDEFLDIGINFYFNPDLKLSLHYTLRDGASGEMGDGFMGNNYFNQSGVGAIRRGDWLGLGVVTVL